MVVERATLPHRSALVAEQVCANDLPIAEVLGAGYYNYHRLHGELDWQTPAERFDGTPFADRGFASVPALAAVADLLDAMLAA